MAYIGNSLCLNKLKNCLFRLTLTIKHCCKNLCLISGSWLTCKNWIFLHYQMVWSMINTL